MKNHLLGMVALLCFAGSALAQSQSEGVGWQLSLLKNNGRGYDSVEFARPVTMKNGDAFQLLIKAIDRLYCYVLYEGGDGSVMELERRRLDAEELLQLPSSDADYVVTEPSGTETFQIIVSAEPLVRLEALLAEAGKTLGADQKLAEEILALRRGKSQFAREREKAVAMGAVSRGIENKIAPTQFEGLTWYVKTITVRH